MPPRWPLEQDREEEEAGGRIARRIFARELRSMGSESGHTKGKTKADRETRVASLGLGGWAGAAGSGGKQARSWLEGGTSVWCGGPGGSLPSLFWACSPGDGALPVSH